ncbi:hypothetical protein [Okeania sp. SIO3I5]|nr:hypothetical protein [Okeania sp. SIO3I5]
MLDICAHTDYATAHTDYATAHTDYATDIRIKSPAISVAWI